MSKSHFLDKYKLLLKLLEPLESDCDEEKIANYKFDSPTHKSASKRPSSIIKEKSSDLPHNDNSIQDLFNEFKFDSERKVSSVVQPSNSFKFGKLMSLETSLNHRDLLKSPKNFITLDNLQGDCVNLEPESDTKDSQPQFINYQNNININFNNYGPINPAVTSTRGNNISQKLQEVFFEINKPDKYFRIKRTDDKFKFRAAMNKLEDLISLKKDTFLMNFNANTNQSTRKKEDYFTDLCKSIHIENKYNKTLRNISDRVLKKSKRDFKDSISDNLTSISNIEKKVSINSIKSIGLDNIEPSRHFRNSKLSSSNRLIIEKLIEKNLENCAYKENDIQVLNHKNDGIDKGTNDDIQRDI
jgi:hypothetical protein